MARPSRGYWVEPRGKHGIYQLCWSQDGRKHRRTTGTSSKAGAEEFLKRFLAELGRPDFSEEPTVAEVLDGYLHARRDRVSYQRLEIAAKHLKEHMGWLTVEELRPKHSVEYTEKRATASTRPATIGNELKTLVAALRWMQGERLVGQLPKVVMPRGICPRSRWLTRQEADNLIRGACAGHVELFIRLALGTGARTVTLLNLRWDQVDLECRFLAFPGSAEGGKNALPVPIGPKLADALYGAKKCRRTDFVIEYAGRPVKRIRGAFDNAVRRAGIEHCTPHDLRRTAGSWMLQAGVQIEVVSRMLGHSSVKVTERVYAMHDVEFLRSAVSALEG